MALFVTVVPSVALAYDVVRQVGCGVSVGCAAIYLLLGWWLCSHYCSQGLIRLTWILVQDTETQCLVGYVLVATRVYVFASGFSGLFNHCSVCSAAACTACTGVHTVCAIVRHQYRLDRGLLCAL